MTPRGSFTATRIRIPRSVNLLCMTKRLPDNKAVIYESPDGGNTVWARPFGEADRVPVAQCSTMSWRTRWYGWVDILQVAQNNPSLENAIQHAEMIYALIKENKK